MAETNTPVIEVPPVDIKRNETTLKFEGHTLSRGDKKGDVYLAPKVNEETFDDVVKFLGKSTAATIIYSRIKQWAQSVYNKCLDEGKFVQVKFEQLASTYSIRGGEKIADLRKELAELNSEVLGLNLNTLDLSIVTNPNHPDYKAQSELYKKFIDLGKQMQEIQSLIESKSRDKEEEEVPATVNS